MFCNLTHSFLKLEFRFLENGATLVLLICALISENQGLEKSRSASNLKKISGPTNLDFFLGLHLENKARFIP